MVFFLYFICLFALEFNSINDEKISKATITSIKTNTSGRTTYDIAEIWFISEKLDTISSKIQLYGLPFVGSFKEVGDTVEISYDPENPYLVKSIERNFLEKYAWHIMIGIALLFLGIKLLKRKKTA
ncbi:MAG: hypothetical protein ACSHW7_12130 [Patiriisocius sp.]|uniref:hypothetical protein n=1 Tax=Patiriisocius sp. TaxID=2822396 RepID=UPI003EF5E05E